MSKERLKFYAPQGANTTAAEQNAAPGVYPVAQNMRLASGAAAVRNGMARLGIIAPGDDAKIIDLDGTDDEASSATGCGDQTPFGTKWSIEFLCQADVLSGTHFILGNSTSVDNIKIKQTSANTIVATITDSTSTTTTLTSAAAAPVDTVIAGLLTRDGAALKLYINNAAAVTGTMSATNATKLPGLWPSIGSDTGASFYNGRIEFVRGFRSVKTSQADGWTRLVNPRSPDVIFDYVMEIDSGTGYVLDRSRFENHLTVAGTPSVTATLLGHPPVPIQSMAGMLTKGNARRLIVTARGLVYSGAY